MTEDRDKWRKWPTLGSRTAKEQNRTVPSRKGENRTGHGMLETSLRKDDFIG